MELKNAVAVCLISLFSATLVVLIARSLDSQAASRLEPQLASIVEELQALRKQVGIAASPGAPSGAETAADSLVVYYFHGNTRCLTCQSIESQARNVVQGDFAPRVASGELVWKVLNYEQPANAHLAKQFDIQVPVVVLARMKAGQIDDWTRLDEVWGLVGDKPAFAKYVRGEIAGMLGSGTKTTAVQSRSGEKDIPSPTEEPRETAVPKASAAKEPLDLPVPE
jgi:hypothetical protein